MTAGKLYGATRTDKRASSGSGRRDRPFVATRVGTRSEVRINGTVHLLTELAPDTTVPIGGVAVGEPVGIFPPSEHDEIWARQEPLNFPKEVFGLERPEPGESKMPGPTRRYSRYLARHDDDVEVG